MAKDPAFLFYSSDFLSGVSDLTMEERGHYITLICLQHQKGHLTKKIIDLNAPNISNDVMDKFSKDENGLFFNKRVDAEIIKRREHSEKQRNRALDGWKKRKATANATALPLENENENEVIIINTTLNKKENILNSKIWIEQICMTKRLELSDVNKYLKLFLDDLELKGEIDKPEKDIKTHFINWINIEISKAKKDSGENDKEKINRELKKLNSK